MSPTGDGKQKSGQHRPQADRDASGRRFNQSNSTRWVRDLSREKPARHLCVIHLMRRKFYVGPPGLSANFAMPFPALACWAKFFDVPVGLHEQSLWNWTEMHHDGLSLSIVIPWPSDCDQFHSPRDPFSMITGILTRGLWHRSR